MKQNSQKDRFANIHKGKSLMKNPFIKQCLPPQKDWRSEFKKYLKDINKQRYNTPYTKICEVVEQIIQEAVQEERVKWIQSIENSCCDIEVMRAKDHNKEIFKYYNKIINNSHE